MYTVLQRALNGGNLYEKREFWNNVLMHAI